MYYFGVDYYPEQWPESEWPEAARLMAEAGFNVVRLAEFAWAKLEPTEGCFDFAWLDRAIEILAGQGMQIVLGTPTASPPVWLMEKHPDAFRVREDGVRLTYGNRREYCPNNWFYRQASCRIVEAMAEHYALHPTVIGWQIDNEFGERCYCPSCIEAFRDWLRRRYVTVEVLNERWGTIFWSHTYQNWGQVPVPLASGGSPNPGLALDFFRFASDSYVDYQREQITILRKICPSHFITHNFMGFAYDRLDYFDLACDLDLVSWNNYPRTQWNMQAKVDPSWPALAHDTMRGLKSKNFWVMEQQAGSGGWEIVSVAPRPGELRLWAYQAMAHGSDGIVFFRWRTAHFGTEQYWHGLLEHDGRPGRRYREIKRMGAEIQRIGELVSGSTIKPAVAMLLSFDSRFAFQIQANNPQFSYSGHFHDLYQAFFNQKVAVDILSPTADLRKYQLVVAPALHVLSAAAYENLRKFVQSGGVLVVTPRSGVKDEFNAVVNRSLPGLLAELCGIQVEEYDSLTPEMGQLLDFQTPDLQQAGDFWGHTWCDVLDAKATTIVARYSRGDYGGKPAITLNRYGRGLAVYIGTFGDEKLNEVLVPWLLKQAGVKRGQTIPCEVEVAERWQGDRRLVFFLNHSEEAQEVTLDQAYTNLLDGGNIQPGPVILPPYEVLVLMKSGE